MNMSRAPSGNYADKQLNCSTSLISWSHRARYRTALELAKCAIDKRLLDYGCGDGAFLALAAPHCADCCGVDINPDQLQLCRSWLTETANLQFLSVTEASNRSFDAAFDVVTCMETLEHCVWPTAEKVLLDLRRLCRPDGHIIISVPIEIGPTFVLKSIVRKMAGLKSADYGHYERYPARDAIRMIFATCNTRLTRPIYGSVEQPNHSHYGFNWRWMRERVQEYFVLQSTTFSPIRFPGGLFASQAWFICRQKEVNTRVPSGS